MQLKTYLEQHNISVAGFAKMIDAGNAGVVYRYLTGKRRPCKKYAKRIKEATGGAVTSNDFDEL